MENLQLIEKRFHDISHENFCQKMCELYNLGSFDYEFKSDLYNNYTGFIKINGHSFNDIKIDCHNNLYGKFSEPVPVNHVPIYAKVVNDIFSPKVTKSYPNRVFNHTFIRYFESKNRQNLTVSDIKFLFDNEFKCDDNSFKEWLIGRPNSDSAMINHYTIDGITKEHLIG